jgi:hypothetical protein
VPRLGAPPPPPTHSSRRAGFDPLRLGQNKDLLPYFREAELTNGRWAMAAVAGILFTDLLGLGNWWEAGAQEYAIDTKTQLLVGIPLFAVLEGLRAKGWEKTGESGAFGIHPFDPLGLLSEETRVKEVKNGRLAMVRAARQGGGVFIDCRGGGGRGGAQEGRRRVQAVRAAAPRVGNEDPHSLPPPPLQVAFLGFSSQAAVRGLGPIESLQKHLEDPGHNNIFTSSVGNEVTVAVLLLSMAPTLIEAKNRLSGSKEEEFRPIPW